MQIQSTVRPPPRPHPAQPGLLIGIANPAPELAQTAQRVLGLPERPGSLLLGMPGSAMPDPIDRALAKTGVSVVTLLSKGLAKATNIPVIEHGANVVCLGVKVKEVWDSWQDSDRDVPALLLSTTETALGAANLAYGIADDIAGGDLANTFFDNDTLQRNLGTMFTVGTAAVTGADAGMAVMKQQFGAADIGGAVSTLQPMLDLATGRHTSSGATWLPCQIPCHGVRGRPRMTMSPSGSRYCVRPTCSARRPAQELSTVVGIIWSAGGLCFVGLADGNSGGVGG